MRMGVYPAGAEKLNKETIGLLCRLMRNEKGRGEPLPKIV